jgi:hydroxyethylthiazole kinase-like uncharacterized protein yjeF
MPTTELTPDFVRSLLPERPADGHKGDFGHVFVVGGSRGFTGAVKLCSLGAARSGAGLVTAGIPRALADIVAADLFEIMTLPLNATAAESIAHSALEKALDFAAGKDAVALGPGMSRHPETQRFVLDFVAQCPVPMAIDADGLNAVSEQPSVLDEVPAPRIVTPHPGEMGRLMRKSTSEIQADREGNAATFASRHNCVVVLKGARTLIAAGDELFANPSVNSGMATGGTGDVLTGIIGGLLAQGMTPRNAAVLGVYLHGVAGEVAAEDMTVRAMIAGDVVEALPSAWRIVELGE